LLRNSGGGGDDEDVVFYLAASELHMLVYPDVGMEPLSYYLSFSRLAPLQLAWWGHPITPSTPSLDYYISLVDETLDAVDHYTEQMIRMEWVNLPPMVLEVSDK